MSATKLLLIQGNKAARGNGGSSGGGGGGGHHHGGRRHRRPLNPLNELLWYAMSRVYYRRRSASDEETATRMTNLSRRVLGRHVTVTRDAVSYLKDDCYRRRLGYGWFPHHAQKGADGNLRGYIPILCDVDSDDQEYYLLDVADVDFIKAGFKSNWRTAGSHVERGAIALELVVNFMDATGVDPGALRDFVADCRSLSRRASDIVRRAGTL